MSATDPYVDPRSGVLINKLGITDQRSLLQAERDITRIRIAELARDPVQGKFDLAHLQAVHKHIFSDIYPWAGEIRSVQIAKGESLFAHPGMIESAGAKVFQSIAQDNHFKGMFTDQFIDRASHHFANVNALHPFREGNGRATRVFFEQMGREAGKPIDLSVNSRDAWAVANQNAHNGQLTELRGAFKAAFIAGRDLQHGIER